ncbi:MAG: glycosyltransferase family 2 protein [Fibrobacteres bacterium]|nr:glycosyltransferase family 2 protein [Fibrobacterota bacterium]
MKLSCVIITKNEETNLEKGLPIIKTFADEIIIVDSGSIDKTVETAEAHGAKVFGRHFDGYGAQKRFGVEKATGDWIISLDADEFPTPELCEEIKDFIISPNDIAGVYLPFRNSLFGETVSYWDKREFHLRLFRKDCGNFDEAAVHEKVRVTGRLMHMKHYVAHHSFKDLQHFIDKLNTYAKIGAETAFKAGKKEKCLPELLVRLPFRFFFLFIVRGTFRQGIPGFAWALYFSVYPITKYLFLAELHRNGKMT